MEIPKVEKLEPISVAEMHKRIGVRQAIEEDYDPEPITCGADKGTNEGPRIDRKKK